MKKVVLCASVLSAVAIGYSLHTLTAQAETIDSKATVTAIAGTDPVDPVDPTNPENPGTNPGEEGNNTGQDGSLQINYVSNLLFGENVKLTGKTVQAGIKNTATPYFQVSDLRGTGAGWNLKTSLSDFTNTAGKTIKGASIAFTSGVVRTPNTAKDNGATTTDITLQAGSTAVQSLLKANAGTGRGTWLVAYDKADQTENKKIMFSAPTESIDTQTMYTANLTWQLEDGPTSN